MWHFKTIFQSTIPSHGNWSYTFTVYGTNVWPCTRVYSAALLPAVPCVHQRYWAQRRGFTLLITANCTLIHSHKEACVVPCKWKHVLSLSASRGCTWSSIPTPGGVHNHLRQKKVEFQTGAWLDLQWQTWTSYGPDTGPAQNRQEKALLALEVTQGLPPSTESNRHKQAGVWPECVKALWCLSFTFFKESQITHWNDSKAKKFYQNEPFSVNYSSNGCIRTLSSFFP